MIDPDESLFGSRLIARNDFPANKGIQNFDNFTKGSKDIRFVLPGFDTMGVAVDDSAEVWKNMYNVITVTKFQFWEPFQRLLADFQRKGITDEEARKDCGSHCSSLSCSPSVHHAFASLL